MQNEETKRKKENLRNAAISGAATETVQRYGSAAKEHLVAYSGHDHENGIELNKSLKSISKQGTNEKNAYSIRQQKAGFAAEVKDTAKKNAQNIIDKNKTRKIRYDDLPGQPANHTLYDHVMIDENGNIIDRTESQMKFIGASKKDPEGVGNAKRAIDKLQSKKFEKYQEKNIPIEVPSDEYQDMIDEAAKQIEELKNQIKKQKALGNCEEVKKLEKKLDNLNKIKKNLRPSSVSRKESTFAVDHPELSTAIDVAKISHQAGVKSAEFGAVIGGGVSIIRNLVALCKGEEEPEDAIVNVTKDTACAAAVGYGTGFTGATLKSLMQNSKSKTLQNLSKTNLAGTVVSVTISTTKTMKKYFEGDIDGLQCLEELGEQGTGMIASAMFAVIGDRVFHNFIVGGLIGGMIGYALASATYGMIVSSLKEEKVAKERRIEVEKQCEEYIKMMRQYRLEVESIVEEYLVENIVDFRESFSSMEDALALGDVDWFISETNTITEQFGGEVQFSNMDEFNQKMIDGATFIL